MHKVLLLVGLFSVAPIMTYIKTRHVLENRVKRSPLRYLGRLIICNGITLDSKNIIQLTCEQLEGTGLTLKARNVILEINDFNISDGSLHIIVTSSKQDAVIIRTPLEEATVRRKIQCNKSIQFIHTTKPFVYEENPAHRSACHASSDSESDQASSAQTAPTPLPSLAISTQDVATQTDDPLSDIFRMLQAIDRRLTTLEDRRFASIWGQPSL